MNDLDQFPSLQAFGRQLDALAERDARRASRAPRRRARLWIPADLGAATRFAAALVVVVAVAGGTYAVPASRAAIEDVYGAFSGWVSGDDATAPGRAVAAGEDLPAWVAAENGDKRVLAEAGGDELVAIRQGDRLTLATGGSGTTGTIDDLRESLAGPRIMVAAPGRFLPNGRHDARPLFGLVSSTVARVDFAYADGSPPESAEARSGAFGIVIATDRRPSSLTGYDEAGNVVARLAFVADPRDLAPGDTLGDFRYCPDAGGCPAWAEVERQRAKLDVERPPFPTRAVALFHKNIVRPSLRVIPKSGESDNGHCIRRLDLGSTP